MLDYIYFFSFVFNKVLIFLYIFVVHLVAVKNQDILNDDASHFKLARSVLKIVSFEFSNLQCINFHFDEFKKMLG